MTVPIFIDPTFYGTPDWIFYAGSAVIGYALISMSFPKRVAIRLKLGWGWVYVLEDCADPRIVKVGLTQRTPAIRQREVSRDMTGGADLRLVYAVHVPYAATVESTAHRLLAGLRYRSERGTEWFRLRWWCRGRAVRSVKRAARMVRSEGRRRKCWSDDADDRSAVWLDGIVRPLF